MIDENYYDNARKNLETMRQRVASSKKTDGKDLVEGLTEVTLLVKENKVLLSKPAKELGV